MAHFKRRELGSGGKTESSGTASTRIRRKHKNISANDKKDATATATVKQEKAGDVFTPEAKAAMKSFTYQVARDGVHALRMQYNDLRSFVPPDPSRTAFDSNPTKCRYKDVPCWDKTRVVLKWPPDVANDFLHANWVIHPLLEYQFICSQGPLDGTIGDFWRCVWQEKVKQIIMLCRCEELGKNKCAQYWPANVGETMSHFGLTIKCEKIDNSDRSFIHTRLTLTYKDETRHVDHRQWTTWPDKSVPKTPMAPFRLLQFTRKSPKNPSIIHCSAGIGRTGTLVAIELIYKSLLRAKIPDVTNIVKDIRVMRALAVQTEDQYVYVHYALLQLFHIKNIAPPHFIRHFVKEYENYLKLLNDCGGKNLPLQATTPPQPCPKCSSIVSTMNDLTTNKEAQSPPSESKNAPESKRERKKKEEATDKENSKREKKDTGSKREKKGEACSKREKKEEQTTERKKDLFKKLKGKKDKKKKKKDDGPEEKKDETALLTSQQQPTDEKEKKETDAPAAPAQVEEEKKVSDKAVPQQLPSVMPAPIVPQQAASPPAVTMLQPLVTAMVDIKAFETPNDEARPPEEPGIPQQNQINGSKDAVQQGNQTVVTGTGPLVYKPPVNNYTVQQTGGKKDTGSKREKKGEACSKREKKEELTTERKKDLFKKLKGKKDKKKKKKDDGPEEKKDETALMTSQQQPTDEKEKKETDAPPAPAQVEEEKKVSDKAVPQQLPSVMPAPVVPQQAASPPAVTMLQPLVTAMVDIKAFETPNDEARPPEEPGIPQQNQINGSKDAVQQGNQTVVTGTGPLVYKPPVNNYTVQQTGGKKAIVYHKPNQPFIKALAAPAGQIQPHIFVQNTAAPQPCPPPLQPSTTPPNPAQSPQANHLVGVPFSTVSQPPK
uniref:Protein tyrosine phosphatase n=1 Tax=Panagrolaimus sp. JU765 TaxID=591449 RepID=A0AC34QAQ7_9BILA